MAFECRVTRMIRDMRRLYDEHDVPEDEWEVVLLQPSEYREVLQDTGFQSLPPLVKRQATTPDGHTIKGQMFGITIAVENRGTEALTTDKIDAAIEMMRQHGAAQQQINDFRRAAMEHAANEMARKMDEDIMTCYKDAAVYGTAGHRPGQVVKLKEDKPESWFKRMFT